MKAEYATDIVRRIKAQHRRDSLRALKLCVNGAKHGPATHGVCCERCRRVHSGTLQITSQHGAMQ